MELVVKKVEVRIAQLCPTLCIPILYSPRNSPGQNTGASSLSLLQGIFPTQESNWGLPHCRQILYQLSHKGSPRILEWVDFPFSRGASWPRNQTAVSCISGGFILCQIVDKLSNYSIKNQEKLLTISLIKNLHRLSFDQFSGITGAVMFFIDNFLKNQAFP